MRPAAVLLDEERHLLFVVDPGSKHVWAPSFQDCLTAQISAAVVAAEFERERRRRLTLRLYLAYADHVRHETH